jgi:nitrogen fixation protein FixH
MSDHLQSTPTGGLTGRKVALIFVAFFGTIASADAFLVFSAVTTWSGADATSPYKAGQLYNSELALARSQNAGGWTVSAGARREEGGRVRVSAGAHDADDRAVAGRTVLATLQRPTDQREDRKANLREEAPGLYSASIEGVASGQWDLVVDILEGDARAFRRRVRVVLP